MKLMRVLACAQSELEDSCEPPLCLMVRLSLKTLPKRLNNQHNDRSRAYTWDNIPIQEERSTIGGGGGCVVVRRANGFLIKRRGGYRFYFECVTTEPKSTCTRDVIALCIGMIIVAWCVCVWCKFVCSCVCERYRKTQAYPILISSSHLV